MVCSNYWREEEGTLRLAFQKINENIKDKKIFDILQDEEVDMMEFAEMNICWSNVNSKDRLWDCTRG